ncbi:methionine ABC transporter ATP-binding protein [Haploplasma axanthum]|nr:ATP-binding cassette domain-containing protein [Haploplasma axanthum]
MIELVNVSKIYKLENKKESLVLKDVSLSINESESIGIVGYSGAGKSTLIRLLNGLVKPSSGNVLVDGIDINSLKKNELNFLRHKIGMIFQDYNLLSSLKVIDNVLLSLKISKYSDSKSENLERAKEVLNLVGLSDKLNEYPKNLSGGQRQRVAIARAIASKPKYLLCDEITSALDNNTALEIIEILNDIKEKTNVTIIFITHQLEMVRKLCDRVVVMDSGEIIEDQKVLELFISPKTKTAKTLINLKTELDEYNDNTFILKYKNSANKERILSETIKKFEIDFNILSAKTLDIGKNIVGYLILEITGNRVDEAIIYLKNKGIEVEKYEVDTY